MRMMRSLALSRPRPRFGCSGPWRIPTGFRLEAHGLRGTSYPCHRPQIISNRNAVAAMPTPFHTRTTFAPTALRLMIGRTMTQGRRRCANLGLEADAPLGHPITVGTGSTRSLINPRSVVTSRRGGKRWTRQHFPFDPCGRADVTGIDQGRRGNRPYRTRGQDSVFPIFGQWIWSDQGELGRDAGLT